MADMIDWLSVMSNGLWIVGTAILLAALSYYYFIAQQRNEALSGVLGRRTSKQVFLAGLLLIGLGLATTSRGFLQAIPSVLLIISCFVALVALQRTKTVEK